MLSLLNCNLVFLPRSFCKSHRPFERFFPQENFPQVSLLICYNDLVDLVRGENPVCRLFRIAADTEDGSAGVYYRLLKYYAVVESIYGVEGRIREDEDVVMG